MTKNRLKKGQRSDTYLPHICRLPWSIENPKRTEKKLQSTSTADKSQGLVESSSFF